ncbi:MAG: hypothetical protein Q9219_004889 [cf. Caloplaca sp. 3 TL-2023]
MASSKSPTYPLTLSSSLEPPPPPPYSEINHDYPTPASSVASHIRKTVTSHILPHLNDTNPLTTIVLIPSDVSALNPAPPSSVDNDSKTIPPDADSFKHQTPIGFPADENPILVRLSGLENRLAFWQKPAAVRTLRDLICAGLRKGGYHILPNPSLGSEERAPEGHRTRGSEVADWRFVERLALGMAEARVEVGVREVCARVVSAIGLFETRWGRAVVVRVERRDGLDKGGTK